MVSQTNEQALEAAIEKALTGTCLEDIKAGVQEAAPYFGNRFYKLGQPTDFDMHYALDTNFFWQFLETTQEEESRTLDVAAHRPEADPSLRRGGRGKR